MLGRAGIFMLIVVLGLLPLSCAKIPEDERLRLAEEYLVKEGLVAEELPYADSIPSEWGNLVSVSSVADRPYMVQLWFQDENGNLRIADYHISMSRFAKHFRVIHRK
jgi:hypothetical protein